jgi:hypothetical protein
VLLTTKIRSISNPAKGSNSAIAALSGGVLGMFMRSQMPNPTRACGMLAPKLQRIKPGCTANARTSGKCA